MLIPFILIMLDERCQPFSLLREELFLPNCLKKHNECSKRTNIPKKGDGGSGLAGAWVGEN